MAEEEEEEMACIEIMTIVTSTPVSLFVVTQSMRFKKANVLTLQ